MREGCESRTYLNKKALQKSFVGVLVICQLSSQIGFGLLLQGLNILVDLSHSLNSLHILLFGLFNLHADLLVGNLVLEVLLDLHLLLLKILDLLDGEFINHTSLNSSNFLNTVLLDESNHGIKNLLGLYGLHYLLIDTSL